MFENYKVPSNLKPQDPRFGSGPSLIPMSFFDSLRATDVHLMGTSHRKDAVKKLVKEMQDGLRTYFKLPADYTVAIGNGGATFLFDMIGLGLVKNKSVHFTCGEFSEKWYKSHKKIPWISAENRAVPTGQGIEAEYVDGADMICTTLNETSTGVQINTFPKMPENCLLAVDATSGAGQVPCDISKVDVFFFSPQKVFASEGGFFVAFMSPKARARALEIAADKNRYIPEIMSWTHCLENSDKHQTYNTPAVTTIFLLNEQVKLMNKLGYDKVCQMAREKANVIYNWAASKPYLEAYVADEKHRSIAVATINVDESKPVDGLIEALEKQKAVYGIDGYRKLGKNQFRISLFHNITIEDTKKLTELLSDALENG